jgi:hypothetical protein
MAAGDAPSVHALASLVGRNGVIALTQDGTEFRVAVTNQAGDTLTVLAPRMSVGGIDTLELRFSVDDHTWHAVYDFESAEYHSHELGAVTLRLKSVEPFGTGVRAAREEVYADGTLRVIEGRNVLSRNTYPITVEDISATGLRFTCDFEIAVDDVFTLSVAFQDRASLHVRARAAGVEPAPFGRKLVRARIEAPVAGEPE